VRSRKPLARKDSNPFLIHAAKQARVAVDYNVNVSAEGTSDVADPFDLVRISMKTSLKILMRITKGKEWAASSTLIEDGYDGRICR